MSSRTAFLAAMLALLCTTPALALAATARERSTSRAPSAYRERLAIAVKPPTPAQMRAAVRRAERSKDLWATVNICDTARHPNRIGIRGQMPALGFPAALNLIIKLYYYSLKVAKFVPIPHVQMRAPLGTASTGFFQGGAIFKFKPPVILSGAITFQWRVGRKLLGQATRLTGHGYKGVDAGDPPGTSHATCRIN